MVPVHRYTPVVTRSLLLLVVLDLFASALSYDLDLDKNDFIKEGTVLSPQSHKHRHQQQQQHKVKVRRQLTSVADGGFEDQGLSPHHSPPSQCPDNCHLHVYDINKVTPTLYFCTNIGFFV